MSQTRSNFQFVPAKQDPLILTKAADLVCYGFKNSQLNQRTKGWLVLHVALLTGVNLSSKLLRSGIAAGQGSRFMNGKMLGLVTENLVIPVDGRNLAPVDRYSSLFPFVSMVCFNTLFSSTNSDLPFIHVICWLVTISSPMFSLLNYLIYLPFCDLRSQRCCFFMSCPQCKGFLREICQDWLGLFMISFEVGEKSIVEFEPVSLDYSHEHQDPNFLTKDHHICIFIHHAFWFSCTS